VVQHHVPQLAIGGWMPSLKRSTDRTGSRVAEKHQSERRGDDHRRIAVSAGL